MIRKAVIPVAGAGTRLLPATKAQPKEMLPILDTPAVQYVVQEAVDSGIEEILFVTGRGKRAIEDHFDRNLELEAHLARRGDAEALAGVQRLGEMARIHYVRQTTQAGLGDAILCAETFVGSDPFVVLLGDTVMDSRVPVAAQLMAAFQEHRVPVLGVETVPAEKVNRYGIVEAELGEAGELRVRGLTEKPLPGETPSTLAIAGRYVLTPEVFKALRETEPGKNEEVQLTDALAGLLATVPMIALPIHGRRYDIGNKTDYLNTILAFASKKEEFAEILESFCEAFASGSQRR
jgi:UTP--glucose-1-phosphate uridylyltransferase